MPEIDILKIPDLLVYFVPGYIFFWLYDSLCRKKPRSINLLLSCVASFVFVAITWCFFIDESVITTITQDTSITQNPSIIKDENLIWRVVIISCTIAALSAVILSLLVCKTSFQSFLQNTFNVSSSPSVILNSIKIEGRGTTIRAYLKDVEYYVVGSFRFANPDKDDPWITLRHYTLYSKHNGQEITSSTDDSEYFIFNINNVLHMETWPTQT